MEPDDTSPHKRAIAALGGPAAAAQQLNVSLSSIYHWKAIPHKHVLRVAALTGIRPEELRPVEAAQ